MEDYKIHHVNNNKFELHKNGESIGYLDYHTGSTTFYIDYVYVEPQHRNNEEGIKIVEAGLDYAKEKGMQAKAICNYAKTVMMRKGWF